MLIRTTPLIHFRFKHVDGFILLVCLSVVAASENLQAHFMFSLLGFVLEIPFSQHLRSPSDGSMIEINKILLQMAHLRICKFPSNIQSMQPSHWRATVSSPNPLARHPNWSH
jgi:hypothetical protein